MFRQFLLEIRQKIGLLQVVSRDIDANRDLQPLLAPGSHLRQGGVQAPIADPYHEFAVFNQGQEFRRRQHAAFRMLPADQGFGTKYGAGAHIDLGLVIQNELILLEGLRDTVQAAIVGPGLLVLFRVEDVITVLAGLLGLVHGLIGVAQQGVGIATILWVQGDAEAGRDLNDGLTDFDRGGRGLQQSMQDVFAFDPAVQVGEYGDELVTAQTGQRVAAAQVVAQTLRQRNQ